MDKKWKRVFVQGKGWRYTDGKSYRLSPPGPEQSVKKIVKGAVKATKKAAKGWKEAASKSGEGRTLTRTSNTQSDKGAIGLRGNRAKEDKALKQIEESEKAAQSGQYGRYGQPSSQVKFEESKPAPKATSKPAPKATTSKSDAKPTPKPASKPAPKPASKPTSAPKSDKKRKSIADTLKSLERMKRRSKKRQGVEDKAKGTRKAGKQYGSKAMSSGKTGASVNPGYTPKTSVKANYADKQPANRTSTAYSSATKKLSKPAQKAKPAQAAKPNTKSKLRQAMEERMKKRRGRGY